MRLGAAIIVVMGALIAALVLFERRIDPEVQRLKNYLTSTRGTSATPTEEIESAKTCLLILTIFRYAMRLLGVCGVSLLLIWFYKVSHRRFRSNLPRELPRSNTEVMRRLVDREQSRFQYGILSLLALTLAVALVCSAVVYPLK
jgi:hypothetical protein